MHFMLKMQELEILLHKFTQLTNFGLARLLLACKNGPAIWFDQGTQLYGCQKWSNATAFSWTIFHETHSY